MDLSALDDFLVRYIAEIRSIDDGLEHATRNLARPIKGAQDARGIIVPMPKRLSANCNDADGPAGAYDRILIA
jgi:hypothetical protein